MGLIIFALILFLIVMIHEAGHLVVAKMNGVRVKTFSIGFGPRIVGFKVWTNKNTGRKIISYKFGKIKSSIPEIWNLENLTEYRIAPIPFGGFCQMEGELKSTGKDYELASKRYTQKVFVSFAGVFANFITGFMAIASVAVKHLGFMIGIQRTSQAILTSIILSFHNFSLLFKGQARILSPVEVSQQMSGLSFEQYLYIFGIFSIIMGVVNLLPFPALDGSLPFIFGLQAIFGKKWGQRIAEWLWGLGFLVLMVLQAILFIWWISLIFV